MTLPGNIRTHHLAPLALALFCALALALALAGVAYAQGQTPCAPTNLSVSSSDTEATITWHAPEPGEGTCEPTDYEVYVDRVSDGDRTAGSEVLSPWTATGLEPGTDYQVLVFTYSADCDDYSTEPAEATFTTDGVDAANAEEPAEKHAPKRVRRMRAERVQGEGESDDSAILTWNPPSTKNGKHHAATDYAVLVIRVAENGDKAEVSNTDEITATQFTVEGLTEGNYRFKVAAYSADCNCWGTWRSVKYAHE
ncbi:MAG: fibronectin type III domain-containing protein [Chloroflexi bacterium]|nr:fibronectin type III domain-containing protein [Chloroflexota bacterium]